jgi:hypothetical protein
VPSLSALVKSDLNPSSSALSESQLLWLIARYRVLAGELEREVADFRNANPVHREFLELIEKKIAPIMESGVYARVELMNRRKIAPTPMPDLRTPGPQQQQEKQLADEAIHGTVASLYGKIVRECYAMWDSGKIELNKGEENRFMDVLEDFAKYSAKKSAVTAYQNPFPPNSVQDLEFRRDLGYWASVYSTPLQTVLMKLPPELEQKQQLLEWLYNVIRRAFSPNRSDLPEKYVDEYVRLFFKYGADYLQLRQRLKWEAPAK